MNTQLYRLSFCTTAMDRLDHVRQTLLNNIANNDDYPDIEFVLLDYSSKDGLGDWVKSQAMHLLNSGKLTYFRVDGMKYYSSPHSNNISCLVSTGTVLCTLDADNFVPRGFSFHLNELMHRHPRAFAHNVKAAPSNTKGRIAFFRSDFMQIGGYNEDLLGWGWVDKDLRMRLCAAGCAIQWLHPKYAKHIAHDNKLRTQNMGPGRSMRFTTSKKNEKISRENIAQNIFIANSGRVWGAATLTRNFSQIVTTGIVQQNIYK
jgi:N-terminal domain of galactosyltransferase